VNYVDTHIVLDAIFENRKRHAYVESFMQNFAEPEK
jgi:hypothetical protein